jgi:hypothetical protein
VAALEVDFGADEAMSPKVVDEETAAEQRGKTVIVSATDEDDHTSRVSTEVQIQISRERSACGRPLDASSIANTNRRDPSIGTLLQILERGVLEAAPHFGLPAAVETFDGILKTRLAGRSEDRFDIEKKTGTDDSTNHVGVLMVLGKSWRCRTERMSEDQKSRHRLISNSTTLAALIESRGQQEVRALERKCR